MLQMLGIICVGVLQNRVMFKRGNASVGFDVYNMMGVHSFGAILCTSRAKWAQEITGSTLKRRESCAEQLVTMGYCYEG